MISELKTAFQIGFLIYMPFLIIDIVVASTLMSMGMMMLPPAMISLPFKLLLFVLVDGWSLLGAEPRSGLPHMTQTFLQGLLTQIMIVSLKLALPTLVAGLGVGLVISVLQAVTQIQEMTLTFVPKVVAVAVIMLVAGPWMLNTLLTFTTSVYDQIPNMTASLR